MPGGTGPVCRLVVVLTGKQVEIPDLRDTRHEELDRPRQSQFTLIFSEGAEESGVDLVVGDLLAIGTIEVFHPSAAVQYALHHRVDLIVIQQQLARPAVGLDAFEIEHRNAVMATQHVDGLQSLAADVIDPIEQVGTGTPVQGVNDEAREKEVVDGIAFRRHLFMQPRAVLGMDFGKDGQVIALGDGLQPFQIDPGSRFVEEVGLARSLVQVGKGVEAHDPGAIALELFQGLFVEGPDLLRAGVQIHLTQVAALLLQQGQQLMLVVVVAVQVHVLGLPARLDVLIHQRCQHRGGLLADAAQSAQLSRIDRLVADLLIEGVPVGPSGAVREADLENRQAGLAHEELVQIVLLRNDVAILPHLSAVPPELVPIDEKVPVLGLIPLLQQIFELGRGHGEMVENQVELEGDTQGIEGLDIGLGDQVPVEVVIDNGEATIEVTVEKGRQDIEKGKNILELGTPQQTDHIGQSAADAVGIGIQHDAAGQLLAGGLVSHLCLKAIWSLARRIRANIQEKRLFGYPPLPQRRSLGRQVSTLTTFKSAKAGFFL